jgi:hypothetical protein
MAQVIECLLRKHEPQSSTPSIPEKKKHGSDIYDCPKVVNNCSSEIRDAQWRESMFYKKML